MKEDRIESTVLSMIDRFTRVSSDDLNTIIDDLGFDSLDYVELLIELEKEFNIHINDAEFVELKTINDVINIVKKNI